MAPPLLEPDQPNTGHPPPMRIAEILLSTQQKFALPDGATLDQVRDDMAGGIWIARYRSSGQQGPQIYRLGGSRFEARVRRRKGQSSGAWLAEVTAIELTSSMPRRYDRIVPAVVSFEPNYRELAFDMEDLLRQLEQWRQIHEGRVGAPASEHLKRVVHLEYGRLKRLLEIVEQRPEAAEQTVSGIVLSVEEGIDGAGTVVVDVKPATDLADFDRRRVTITASSGLTVNTSVQRVRAGRLAVRQTGHWSPKRGTEVTVNLVKPFGMRQNVLALNSFLNGEVEGSWDDLARLLCQPQNLTAQEPLALPQRFFCDDSDSSVPLNDEQRRAVAGAVSTPHAFLVQGPPGTGKTEVICEIVRQLTARGERVLLLAPTHVAVDEVLGRIGHKPGVRPLRITWDDDRVHESVRDYLEPNVGAGLTGLVVRPEKGARDPQWAAELIQVEERVQDARRAISAIADKRRQATASAHTRVALAAAAERLELSRVRADQELATLNEATESATARVDAAASTLSRTVRIHDALLATARPILEPLPPLARSWQAAMRVAATAANALDAANTELGRAAALLNHDVAEARNAVTRADLDNRAAVARLEDALAELRRAQLDLNNAVSHQNQLGRMLTAMNLGRVTAARRRADEAEAAVTYWRNRSRSAMDWQRTTEGHMADVEDRRTNDVAAARERAGNARQQMDAAVRQSTLRWIRLAEAAGDAQPAMTEVADMNERRRVAAFLAGTVPALLAGEPLAGADHGRLAALGSVGQIAGQLSQAVADLVAARQEQRAALEDQTWCRRELELGRDRIEGSLAAAEQDFTEAQSRYEAAAERVEKISQILAGRSEDPADHSRDIEQLERRLHVLRRLPALHQRWCELTSGQSDDLLLGDIRESLVRAANLVCATTKGIVGRGSQVARYADYDTLIVDEASRVTESEFLIGATRARRWILVGDEHQLPPHVDQRDEHFLHALTALHRFHRGAGESLEASVHYLAQVWAEDEELHKFRTESVLAVAEELSSSGLWATSFRDPFDSAYRRVQSSGNRNDPDRQVLTAMLRHLVQSLFQRVAPRVPAGLRQELVWQRRMIEPLARIVAQPVYRGRYRTPPAADLAAIGLTPLVLAETLTKPVTFVDTSHFRDSGDTPQEHGFVNEREQDFVERVCRRYNEDLGRSGSKPVTVSVLAFYRAQAQQLSRRLRGLDLPHLQWEVIDVIDRIQGQQSDLVIISFTRAHTGRIGPRYGQWLQDIRRLNVAFTRARRALVFVGHGPTLSALGAPSADAEPGPARIFYENLFNLVEQDDDFMRVRRL